MDPEPVEGGGDGVRKRDRTDRLMAMVVGLFVSTATMMVGITLLLSQPDSGRGVVQWDWFVVSFFFAYTALWLIGTRIAAIVVSTALDAP